MITATGTERAKLCNGHGRVAAGGEYSGKTHISYKPYGQMELRDSTGPDIFKYKYTSQEYEPSTGLYYYKARHYDPVLGRFLQADAISQPKKVNGMNAYMYVEGRPTMETDPTGHAGCPFGGNHNFGVAGNYSGPGRCGGELPSFIIGTNKDSAIFWRLIQSGNDLGAFLFYKSRIFKPLTEVDKASQIHDEEFDPKSPRRNIAANHHWLRDAYFKNFVPGTYIPDTGYISRTYTRELKATPKWYGKLRPAVAAVNTYGDYLADSFVLHIGVPLFSAELVIDSVREWSVHALFIPHARFKNLWRPKKWHL